METNIVQITTTSNRTPADRALDWLLAQNLEPGDVVALEDLDCAMGLPDPNALIGKAEVTRWALTRLPLFQQTVERFEGETGEILLSVGRGRLIVVAHEDVAQALFEPAYAQVLKIFARAGARLANALRDDVSSDELTRRNRATEKMSNMSAFMMREKRRRISD